MTTFSKTLISIGSYLSVLLLVASCGSNNDKSPPMQNMPPAESLDDIVAETSQFWDSATRQVAFSVLYNGIMSNDRVFSNNTLTEQGFGNLPNSNFILYSDQALWLGDDFGNTILEVDLSTLPSSQNLDSATEEINSSCSLTVSQSIEYDGLLAQDNLVITFVESVALSSANNQPGCGSTLESSLQQLDAENTAEFAFDVITLLSLDVISTDRASVLQGWEIAHEQTFSNYYKLIADEDQQLVSATQRIAYQIFEPAADRAAALASQLVPEN